MSRFRRRSKASGPSQTQVFVRFADQEQWEAAPMRSAEEGQFDFKLYAVRGPLTYYVQADGVRSPEHNIGVVDLPKIQRVRLTYQYPEWTGLDAATDEESRDIRAVAGTDVKVEVFADAPLEAPALIVDGQQPGVESGRRRQRRHHRGQRAGQVSDRRARRG